MAQTHAPSVTSLPAPAAPVRARRWLGGGTDGNERLTSVTGALLVVLLAVIGVTIINLRGLLWVHLFVGLLLIAPVSLKLASTGYRFVRYYTHDPAYRRKGPPLPALRALAPLVVLTTLVVFASGVALLFAGPSSRSALLPVHKISFIVWAAVTGVHLLAHLPACGPARRPRRHRLDPRPLPAGPFGAPARAGGVARPRRRAGAPDDPRVQPLDARPLRPSPLGGRRPCETTPPTPATPPCAG